MLSLTSTFTGSLPLLAQVVVTSEKVGYASRPEAGGLVRYAAPCSVEGSLASPDSNFKSRGSVTYIAVIRPTPLKYPLNPLLDKKQPVPIQTERHVTGLQLCSRGPTLLP